MSIWTPGQSHRRPVQLTGKDRVCVLVHKDTNRILCFCFDDPFVQRYIDAGYKKVEILHAHEYDTWARRLREQASVENQAADHAYLEREDAVRKRLRQQLRDRLRVATSGLERQTIESALHTLDVMQSRKKRYRAESFMLNEAYESTKEPGEELVRKIICNE